MNVINLLCVSASAHIFCMFKNVSVFPRVNVDARRTADQRRSNVGTSRAHALNSLCFCGVFVDRGLSQSDINDAQTTHDKIQNNNLSPDCEKRRKLVANAQRVFNTKGE